MRKELAKEDGVRKKFFATIERFGKKKNYKGYSEDTILLKHVRDAETEAIAADHIWFTFTKGFEDARISAGDLIEFEARVKKYKKGYVNPAFKINNTSFDYKLSHPTRIKVLSNQSM